MSSFLNLPDLLKINSISEDKPKFAGESSTIKIFFDLTLEMEIAVDFAIDKSESPRRLTKELGLILIVSIAFTHLLKVVPVQIIDILEKVFLLPINFFNPGTLLLSVLNLWTFLNSSTGKKMAIGSFFL